MEKDERAKESLSGGLSKLLFSINLHTWRVAQPILDEGFPTVERQRREKSQAVFVGFARRFPSTDFFSFASLAARLFRCLRLFSGLDEPAA
jgi:hypothetical protein